MSKEKNGIKYFGINQNGSASEYIFRTINIGDWNMNSALATSVSNTLTFTEVKTIKDFNVVVRNDADTNYYPIIYQTSNVFENRFGPTNNLNIFNWGLTATNQTLDKNYNLYFPNSASTTDDFYVNNTYALSAYNGFNYSFIIPKNTDTYSIDIKLFLNLQMYHSYPTSAAPANKTPGTAQALFCDVILKQGSTTLNTSTYNLGNLPSTLQGTSNRTNFYLSCVETLTESVNATEQLYFNLRFYTTSNFIYTMDAIYGGAAIATNYDVYTLSTSASTQSYFGNYNGQDSSISTGSFKLKSNSFFQTTNFDSTSYNRGFITFMYKPG